jgi:hypothetical protein
MRYAGVIRLKLRNPSDGHCVESLASPNGSLRGLEPAAQAPVAMRCSNEIVLLTARSLAKMRFVHPNLLPRVSIASDAPCNRPHLFDRGAPAGAGLLCRVVWRGRLAACPYPISIIRTSLGIGQPRCMRSMRSPRVTQKLIDVALIDIVEWLRGKVAEKFAYTETDAFFNGNGVARPRSFLTYTTAATADPSRAWGELEHVKSGANGDFASSNPADKLIDLVSRMKIAVSQGCRVAHEQHNGSSGPEAQGFAEPVSVGDRHCARAAQLVGGAL